MKPVKDMTEFKYKILIKNNQTGETVDCSSKEDDSFFERDEDSTEFWWSEGNMGCDCNRELHFYRYKGLEPEDTECSDDRFSVKITRLKDNKDLINEM